MACCPPGSLPARSALEIGETEAPTGSFFKFTDGSDAYVARPPQRTKQVGGIVLVHDIFGWKNGRTLLLADDLASEGYLVLVPDFFGSDYPYGELDRTEVSQFWRPIQLARAWYALASRVLKPYEEFEVKMRQNVLPFMKMNGVSQSKVPLIGMGICWGGWAITRFVGEPASDFKLLIGIHPTPDNQRLQKTGPSVEAMIERIRVPVLYLMAGNDPGRWKPDGHLWKRIEANNPGSRCVAFENSKHGFINRGDRRVEATKRDVETGIREIKQFLQRHVNPTAKL